MQVVKVVVWEENGVWLGYLQEYPDYWTQGESLEDLREHLKDLYHEFVGGHLPGIRKVEDGRCMKRVKLIKIIEGLGCDLIRHGAKHDWYSNRRSGVSQPVPRHREINEHLARQIIRMLEDEQSDRGGPDSEEEST